MFILEINKHQDIDTSITHIRPRFKLVIPHQQQAVMDRLDLLLKNASDNIKGKILDNHVILDINDEAAHYWSPQMNFRVEQDEENDNHSVVSGLVGPRPEVWTLFMFIYFSVGILGFFISSYGFAKLFLGEHSNLVFVLPITIIIMLSAYGAGKFGEKLAKDQTETLKQFVREAIAFEKNDAP